MLSCRAIACFSRSEKCVVRRRRHLHKTRPKAENGQIVVDAPGQVVLAAGITNLQPDTHHLMPMLTQVEANTGMRLGAAVADAGYWGPDNFEDAEQRGIDIYIATGRQRHGAASPPKEDNATGPRKRMADKLATESGRALYAKRKSTVEPVFGQIKEARGFRRFLLRGIRKVTGEWLMVTATHNLLKLHRHTPKLAGA